MTNNFNIKMRKDNQKLILARFTYAKQDMEAVSAASTTIKGNKATAIVKNLELTVH